MEQIKNEQTNEIKEDSKENNTDKSEKAKGKKPENLDEETIKVLINF